MTARSRVLGHSRTQGAVPVYGPDPTLNLLHIIRPGTSVRTGLCGVVATRRVVVARARAQAIEAMTDEEWKRYEVCGDCVRLDAPQPDPSIWRRP